MRYLFSPPNKRKVMVKKNAVLGFSFFVASAFVSCILLSVLTPRWWRSATPRLLTLAGPPNIAIRDNPLNTDDVFKQIYNNPSSTSIKYDKYSNNLLSKSQEQRSSAEFYTEKYKNIVSSNNIIMQGGCIYRITDQFVYQNVANRKQMRRKSELWLQMGNFLGAPATYQESISNVVTYDKKYKSWVEDLNSQTQQYVSLKLALPGDDYKKIFQNDPNISKILVNNGTTQNLIFSHFKSYNVSTFLSGPFNPTLEGDFKNRPGVFLAHFLLNPKLYNHSILRVSPAWDFIPGHNSLGYSFIVCLNNHYYIYQYVVDHMRYKKKTSVYNEAPMSIFADVPSTSINQFVANYFQGMLFDSFNTNYKIKSNSDDDPNYSPHINHYGAHIFNWLKAPNYYQLLPGTNYSATFPNFPNDVYQLSTNVAFPKNISFRINLAGGKAKKTKFSLQKRPWEYQIGGQTTVVAMGKEKGYKNQRRSEFNFTWDAAKKVAVFTRNFYYFAYLFAIECGQCNSSSSYSSSPANSANVQLNKHNYIQLGGGSDTLAHGTSISLYLFLSLTFGVEVNEDSQNHMHPSTNLVIHSSNSIPSYDPTTAIASFAKSTKKPFSAFLIILIVIIATCLLVLLLKSCFKKRSRLKDRMNDTKQLPPKTLITEKNSVTEEN